MATSPARRLAKPNDSVDHDLRSSSPEATKARKPAAKRHAKTTPAPLVSAALERKPARDRAPGRAIHG